MFFLQNLISGYLKSGASVGIGVSLSILKAYGKELGTAEATQLVTKITSLGLQLDVGSYESLVETSMLCHDFQSTFSLFGNMRESRIRDLKGSYLTIMTSLIENHLPELMTVFLDNVVEDPLAEDVPMIGIQLFTPSVRPGSWKMQGSLSG
ncbi:unnamed protein product [Fraxinus pennsylvanica]|uniref:Uncharacterized protein n=1 Tax=Fraxinus pennsylvanica TaxID=56036 RepID=A0AAD1ZJ38_9LAMI|nr:unnamed protein product [Fraxinus pennsylvanica]